MTRRIDLDALVEKAEVDERVGVRPARPIVRFLPRFERKPQPRLRVEVPTPAFLIPLAEEA